MRAFRSDSKWLAIGVAIAVFIASAVLIDAVFGARLLGWLGLIPAALAYRQVRRRYR